MTLTTLALMLAVANPPRLNLAPTPGCSTCSPQAAIPMMPAPAWPFPQPCPPTALPAPALFSKVLVPLGVNITVHPGTSGAATFAGTPTFAFRPGYDYRLALSKIPGKPDVVLYPKLTVYGSLVPRNGLNYWEFPSPILFSLSELHAAASGHHLFKIVYLEDPSKAVPLETTPNKPLEFNEDTIEAAKKAAFDSGRVVAVITLGDRIPSAEELMRTAVPNTILLPGESTLGAPAGPPVHSWHGIQLFDPIIGPRPPIEECLTDGGDKGPRLGLDAGGKIGGLNPTDVGVEYTQGGKRKVATSNEVCICSPRFAIRKTSLVPGGLRGAEIIDSAHQTTARVALQSRVPAAGVDSRVKPIANDSKIRPMATANQQALHAFVRDQRALAVAVQQGTHIVVSSLGVDEANTNPNRLVVTKSVEPAEAVKPGDIVTFTISYSNQTNAPVSDLVVSDSLSGRLTYVAGSAASDRPTNVTTTPNDAGSVTIRFEIPGQVQPGESGKVMFKAKIR